METKRTCSEGLRKPYVAPKVDTFWVKSPRYLLEDFSTYLEDGIDDGSDIIQGIGGSVGNDQYFNQN